MSDLYVVHGRCWGDDDDTSTEVRADSPEAAVEAWKGEYGLTPQEQYAKATQWEQDSAFLILEVHGPYAKVVAS